MRLSRYIGKLIHNQRFYPSLLGIFVNPVYLARKELIKNISNLSDSMSGKILDIGCGIKPYKKLFKNSNEYIGLEFDSPENRKTVGVDLFYNGKTLPFADNTFDSVILTQVLEHVFNPDELIIEINRVLIKDGHLLLTVPFIWVEHEQPHDYARYSSFGIKYILDKHGFGITKSIKTLNDTRAIAQIASCYIRKIIPFNYYWVKILSYILFISPFTIMGILLSYITPKNDDLFIDNVVLAKNINKL